MTEVPMAKVICSKIIQGEDTLLNLTTVSGAVPLLVKITPGVGKPFWYWPSIPIGKVVACDFTNAPIATADMPTNQALMAAITVLATDVLTYDPPLVPAA